jgi:hypothetical protein
MYITIFTTAISCTTVLSQWNPIHSYKSYYSKTHLDTTHPSNIYTFQVGLLYYLQVFHKKFCISQLSKTQLWPHFHIQSKAKFSQCPSITLWRFKRKSWKFHSVPTFRKRIGTLVPLVRRLYDHKIQFEMVAKEKISSILGLTPQSRSLLLLLLTDIMVHNSQLKFL